MVHLPRVPDLNAQRATMKKLGFLVGKWNGEARLLRGSGEWMHLLQAPWVGPIVAIPQVGGWQHRYERIAA